jgi:hypothetical protein
MFQKNCSLFGFDFSFLRGKIVDFPSILVIERASGSPKKANGSGSGRN